MTEYTKVAAHRATIKSSEEKAIEQAVKLGFPNCKGTYPDCPDEPTIENKKCLACPVFEEIIDENSF